MYSTHEEVFGGVHLQDEAVSQMPRSLQHTGHFHLHTPAQMRPNRVAQIQMRHIRFTPKEHM
jgi:hypothetical protein